jgi:hypothetical protein
MIEELYCLWLGLQDAATLLAMWFGASALLWWSEEIRIRREDRNPADQEAQDE